MDKSKSSVLIFLLLILVWLPLSAQQFELGKVTKAELEEKIHPIDTAAPAAILYEKGKTYFKYTQFGWYTITEVERRIKIYKKSGYSYAEQELNFYKGDSIYNVFSDAHTYNLQGDSVVKIKVGTESEIIHPIGAYSQSKKIFFPDVKEGSIIEFKYIKSRRWRGYLPDWYFQEDIFMNSSVYNVAIPAYFTVNSIISGDIKIHRTPQVLVRSEGFQENRVTYSATNIPAIVYEPYVDNTNNYRASVKHELVAYTSFAAEETKFATSWKTLVTNFFENENFGKQLEIKSYFRKDIDDLLKKEMTADEKINVIFNHVQSRMEWNGYDGYSCYEGVREAYKIKKGNVADINLMLIAMLKYAGIDASPVLAATRDRNIPVYPSTETFNYVLCGVQSAGKLILLDASNKYTTPGIISPIALNKLGRIIKPDGTAVEVDLIPKEISKKTTAVVASIGAGGSISGKIRNQYFDYISFSKRKDITRYKREEYIRLIEKALKGAEISDYKLNDESHKPIVEEYSFAAENIAEFAGNKLIVSPVLFYDEKNQFTAEKRHYPIDFIFPNQTRTVITLNLPEGYVLESYPAPFSIVMGEGMLNFKYDIAVTTGQLQLNVVFEVKESFIEKENYKALQDFFGKMSQKLNEKIVLKKA